MDRIKDYAELERRISDWIGKYVTDNNMLSLVIGVSGGIDSAVASTLAARSGIQVYALGMPIHQKEEQQNLSDAHLEWLQNSYSNVTVLKYDLSETFDTLSSTMGAYAKDKLALANTRSRLRMVTLYQVAGTVRGIVVGTGNKVEDYGVGFYTKYGDGGVDIAPIADLYKTEVWELGKHLGVDKRSSKQVLQMVCGMMDAPMKINSDALTKHLRKRWRQTLVQELKLFSTSLSRTNTK